MFLVRAYFYFKNQIRPTELCKHLGSWIAFDKIGDRSHSIIALEKLFEFQRHFGHDFIHRISFFNLFLKQVNQLFCLQICHACLSTRNDLDFCYLWWGLLIKNIVQLLNIITFQSFLKIIYLSLLFFAWLLILDHLLSPCFFTIWWLNIHQEILRVFFPSQMFSCCLDFLSKLRAFILYCCQLADLHMDE